MSKALSLMTIRLWIGTIEDKDELW